MYGEKKREASECVSFFLYKFNRKRSCAQYHGQREQFLLIYHETRLNELFKPSHTTLFITILHHGYMILRNKHHILLFIHPIRNAFTSGREI